MCVIFVSALRAEGSGSRRQWSDNDHVAGEDEGRQEEEDGLWSAWREEKEDGFPEGQEEQGFSRQAGQKQNPVRAPTLSSLVLPPISPCLLLAGVAKHCCCCCCCCSTLLLLLLLLYAAPRHGRSVLNPRILSNCSAEKESVYNRFGPKANSRNSGSISKKDKKQRSRKESKKRGS